MSFAKGFSAALRYAYRPVEKWMHDARFLAAMEQAEKGTQTKLEIAREARSLAAVMDDLAEKIR